MHRLPGSRKETVHEITVKSFSPARHIRQPGFHLLSLYPDGTPSHAHAPCLLPRADGKFTGLYIPAAGLTIVILIFAQMRRARCAARLRLATASPLPSHVDLSQLGSPKFAPLPSPYSASSAYSYSYAYSNTPPSSQQQGRGDHSELPKRDSKVSSSGGLRPFGKPRPPPLRPPPPPSHEEDENENDDVRAHYLYVPPASPLPGDILSRRTSSRASPVIETLTSPTARAWSFTYSFSIRGRRRRIALHAPAWWPQWAGTRRKGSGLWSAVGRDFGSVMAPALGTWVFLLWWYSS